MARVIRKQTYLTAWQDARIKQIAARKGVKEAEVLREAVDLYLAQAKGQDAGGLSEEAFGFDQHFFLVGCRLLPLAADA